MVIRTPTRADDDRLLEMLALRRFQSTGEIGARFGMTSAAVRVATNRVLDDDIARSGEGREAIVQAYGFSREPGAPKRLGRAA